MRQLSETEIRQVKARLHALKIAYQEIYDEIYDHYCGRLENEPEKNSARVIAELNEIFSWSVVKKMEKELLKNVRKELASQQRRFLKFWNFGTKGILALSIILGLFIVVYQSFGAAYILFAAILLSFGFMGFILYHKRDGYSFSLDPEKHRPLNVLSNAILGRLTIIYGLLPWAIILPGILNKGSIMHNPFYLTLLVLLGFALTGYSMTLLGASYQKIVHKPAHSPKNPAVQH